MGIFDSLFGSPGMVGGSHTGSGIFHMGGYSTDSGSSVSEYNAPTIPAVYACVGLISDAIAQLPIRVYRETSDGGREHIRGHSIERLLNERPNPRMTAFSFRRAQMAHVLLWGNGYAEVQRKGNGAPNNLWLALPDRTTPELREDGSLWYRTTLDGDQLTLEAPDVLHIPGMGFDGVVGYSPVAIARQAMGLARAMESFGAKFYANEGASGGFVQHPGKLSPEALKNLRESLDAQSGPSQSWRPKVLEEGMSFVQTTINPEDAQFLEGRDFQVAEIARIYRVPLHMIQSVSGSTSWGSGIAEMSMGFVRFTLSPWMIPIEQELRAKLFTAAERESGYYLKHDVSDLIRGDLQARGNYYTAALDPDTGWLTREEVRAAEDKDPLPEQDSRGGRFARPE